MVTYSTYEAKTRFSEVIRRVRSGQTVTVSYRGKPVAEVRPIEADHGTIEERLETLTRRGAMVRQDGPRAFLSPLTRRPGALERFLAERDE